MGVLAESLTATTSRKSRHKCEVGAYLGRLDPDDHTALREALALPVHTLGHTALTDSLRAPVVAAKYGAPPPVFTVGKHRRGECACGRDLAA